MVDERRKKAIAWPKPREEGALQNVQRTYNEAVCNARDVGSIDISKGGLAKFTRWYNTRATHTDPFMSSFEAREDDHLLRLAACLAINDGTIEINSGHIGNGSKVITHVKDSARSLFGGDFSYRAKIVGAVGRVRDAIIQAGDDGIGHSELLRRMVRYLDAKELQMLVNILHECGMIQIFKVGKKGKRPKTIYRATQAIEKFGVTSEVLGKLNLEE